MGRKHIVTKDFIKTVKIDLREEFGADIDEDVFIVLREPPTRQIMALSEAEEKGTSAIVECFLEMFPELLVEHSLYKDENTLMSKEEVKDLLEQKMSLAVKVVTDYWSSSFFTQMRKTEEK